MRIVYLDSEPVWGEVVRVSLESSGHAVVVTPTEEGAVAACDEENSFDYLYDLDLPLKDRVEKIATEIYGAEGVEWSEVAEKKIQLLQDDSEAARMGMCMVKTHLSLSHDPDLKGAPKDWVLPIRDVLIYKGAGFVVPVAGDIKLLPGTGSNPGYRKIDVDVETGKVTGLF